MLEHGREMACEGRRARERGRSCSSGGDWEDEGNGSDPLILPFVTILGFVRSNCRSPRSQSSLRTRTPFSTYRMFIASIFELEARLAT
jgi:hypothetical protein